ncbi:anion exchange protein 2 [Apis florea]|uniref:anion exchange protein 2 n=1 Tax=Apis florea TaxID=7463 RepID=UPI0012FF23F1|nr:anion exchange protein 2 [Apis florea]
MPEAAGNSSGKSFLQRASSKVLRWLRRSLRTSHQVDGHGAETGPELDEEMEKVFAMDTGEKFDVARLGSPSESAGSDRERERGPPSRYGDRDFNQHRKRSYPHPHMPLKSLHSRSMRRHLSPEGSTAEAGQEEENGQVVTGNGGGQHELDTMDNGLSPTSVQNADDETTEEMENVVSSESEAPISERAASCFSDSPTVGSPRVQFEKIKEEEVHSFKKDEVVPSCLVGASANHDEDRKCRRHQKHEHKRHHHKSRKYSLQEDPQWRKRSGAGLPDGPGVLARRVSVQPEEASTLQELDIDDLESHRSDDPRGMRRHKAAHSTVQIGRKKEGGIPHDTFKKMYDHSPHEVFVQLDELYGIGEEREWRETARWIKYEEDVEEGADRWGRPHVASLSFHSLLNLRRCLETGVVLLDLEEKDLPGLVYRVVEQMVIEELILPEDRPVVMRALLLRHRHVHDHDRGFRFGGKRNYASYTSLQSVCLEEEDAAREASENHVTQHVNLSFPDLKNAEFTTFTASLRLAHHRSCTERSTKLRFIFVALLAGEEEKKPPDDDDPLRRTKRPFGGLINDIKRRYPFYLSDFTDGLSSSCLAAAIFMYFAALCTAITFGGLMSDKTHNVIGISETLVSGSWTGVVMALFSTQPLVIIGTTGPLLLFDESLYNFCLANELEFLTVRVYVGAWMGIIALAIACVEGSVLVRLFTRFTEEIFTGLISILYIVETFIKLYNYFVKNPLLDEYSFVPETNKTFYEGPLNVTEINIVSPKTGETIGIPLTEPRTLIPAHNAAGILINQPNTALMCTILCLGTFLGAYYLRIFRNSHYLGRSARRAFGDFGVPISIVVFALIDYLAKVKTEKLLVPEGLTPTLPGRNWIVSPAGVHKPIPLWMAMACIVPALLVYILVFMETQISELIIDKKERKLRKGNGYHMDIVVVCLMNVGCGLMGAPWCCAASVRSLTHVSAVTVMSRTHAPGDKPHIVEVKEQRVSALLVAVLIGVSVLMAPLLRRVPMSVLLGVFLYMGISSTNGVQLFDRVKLFFMPVKHHGTANYVRRVQTYKMHIFTLIQILCLAILWIVKSTRAALALPFFLILMIPLRGQMNHFFTAAELRALDSKGSEHESTEDEPDFYEEAPLPG